MGDVVESLNVFISKQFLMIDILCITSEIAVSYRQISNIKHTKSQNLNVSHLVLQLSLPNPIKSGVKSRMKM